MRTGASFDGVYVAQWAEGQKGGGDGGGGGGGGGDGGGRHGGGWGVRAIGASHCDGFVESERERERERGRETGAPFYHTSVTGAKGSVRK